MDDLRLTPLSLDDADTLLAFEIANRAWFEAWVSPRPEGYWQRDSLRAIIRAQVKDPEPMYLIRAGETIVGRLNLTGFEAGSAEIGYRIGADWGGKGVATRAVLLAAEAARSLGLTALRARIRRPHPASARVLEKTGFALVSSDAAHDLYRKTLSPRRALSGDLRMNPLLTSWTGPFALPPFDEIADAHFAPAIEATLAEARARIDEIAGNPEAPSFANTIEALESANDGVNRVLNVFFNLSGADANPAREALQREISPKLAAFSSDITLNPALFARIEALWQGRDGLALDPEQARLLLLTRRRFARAGALLEGEDRDRLRAIMERLAALGTEFMQNLLADEREWALDLSDADIRPLPAFLQDAARAAGEERGAQGPVITTSRSLVTPFLASSPDRALRARAYEAFTNRGARGNAHDNRKLAAEILALRAERAALLGYADFASFKLETEMAGRPEAVEELLMAVWPRAKAAAEADAARLEAMLQADGHQGPLEPWDWAYYAEKRRAQEHDLDQAEVKAYLQLDRMIEAAFDCAQRLFGLSFTPLDVPLYHPDARAWEVTRDGTHMAVFIGDYFARGSKRSGAWCSRMRSQKTLGEATRPIVVNICNFVKPPEGAPALLSSDDARTLFHEFGHALHNILSDVTYGSISGTNVARDFVELPSQLYEHWLDVPEVLDRFATHAETGAPMPPALRDKLLGASRFNMGFQTVEYLASAFVDLAFHRGAPPADPMQRQAEVLEEIGLPHAIRMRHATPHFAHVFAGDGYSAGYYSYMWSEVMDADAFEAFEAAGGPFDSALAARLEETILSVGDTVEAGAAYQAFRGQMPGVAALLRGRGLTGG